MQVYARYIPGLTPTRSSAPPGIDPDHTDRSAGHVTGRPAIWDSGSTASLGYVKVMPTG